MYKLYIYTHIIAWILLEPIIIALKYLKYLKVVNLSLHLTAILFPLYPVLCEESS